MVYDRPKAAHFDCYQGGKLLPPNDETGLHLRWRAARLIEESVTDDMLDQSMMPEVDRFLEAWCDSPLWKIRRRVPCQLCDGTGECDSGGFTENGSPINIPCECSERNAP